MCLQHTGNAIIAANFHFTIQTFNIYRRQVVTTASMNSRTIISSCRIFLKTFCQPFDQRRLIKYCDSLAKLLAKLTGLLVVTVLNLFRRCDWAFTPSVSCYQHACRFANVITGLTFRLVVLKLFRWRNTNWNLTMSMY
jgi:hypothetical protein